MGDTNNFSGIVKILENPIQTFVTNKLPVIILRVEVPQIRKNRIISLIFWGKLAYTVKNYYQINDYILIEGYLSIQNQNKLNLLPKNFNSITITVLKVYPFLFKSNASSRND